MFVARAKEHATCARQSNPSTRGMRVNAVRRNWYGRTRRERRGTRDTRSQTTRCRAGSPATFCYVHRGIGNEYAKLERLNVPGPCPVCALEEALASRLTQQYAKPLKSSAEL